MTSHRTLIIAEAGVNHNGSVDLALQLVDAGADAGADVVKFQTFDTAALVTADAPRADYQRAVTGSAAPQFDMLRDLELDVNAHERLRERCSERGVEFLSTAFDHASLEHLLDIGLRRLKSPSGEITNGPLLLRMARAGLPIIVSTGMANLAEIEQALAVLAFGFVSAPDAVPDAGALARVLSVPAAREALREWVTLLHCTSAYPAPLEDVNLRAMDAMAAAFGLAVGYSDHTTGIAVPIAAVARGATVIEKHLTVDRGLPGPDHAASLEPDEMAAMVDGIRTVECALGTSQKGPTRSEVDTIQVARKSVVAARPLAAGQVLAEDDLAVMRPGGGRSPMDYWPLIGQRTVRAYRRHEAL